MTKKEKELEALGGSCIIPMPRKQCRRDTDYDGYNDYLRIIIEGERRI